MFRTNKVTLPQSLMCLVLKEFLRLDYRDLAAHLADHVDLRDQIGLKTVPPYTTFENARSTPLRGYPVIPKDRKL